MSQAQTQAFDELRSAVHGYARVARQRWRLGVVALGLVGSVAFWLSQYVPRRYEAVTVFERRDDVVLRNLIASNSPYSFEQMKATIALDMTGSRALAEALQSIGVLPEGSIGESGALNERERALLDAAVQRYDLRPRVKLLNSSASLDTIDLRCESNDPLLARELAIALRDRYVAQTRAQISGILARTREFFFNEVTRLQAQAAEARSDLEHEFSEFPGLDPTQPGSVGMRLEALRAERNELSQRLAELDAQVSAREQFLCAPPEDALADLPGGDGRPVLPPRLADTDAALEKTVQEVQRELAECFAVRRMTAEHPHVKALERKLAGLDAARAALARAAEQEPAPRALAGAAIGPRFQEWYGERLRVELELNALRKQAEICGERFAEADRRFARLSELMTRLQEGGADLRRLEQRGAESMAAAAVWQNYLAQIDRVLAAESSQRGTQFTLLEEPKEVSRPVRPQAAAVLSVCGGLGLAAALLLVILAELLDRSFRSAADVTRVLGLPVLECVDVIPTPRQRRRDWLRRCFWTPALGGLMAALLVCGGLAYASLEHPRTHARLIAPIDALLRGLGAPSAASAAVSGREDDRWAR